MTDPKEPEKRLHDRGLELALWRNDGEYGPTYSGKLSRSYRDSEGEWQKTQTLREQDMLVVPGLVSRGYEYARRQNERSREQSAPKRGPQGPSR